MTVCMYRDIHTLQPYIIDFTQRGCHTLRFVSNISHSKNNTARYYHKRTVLHVKYPVLHKGRYVSTTDYLITIKVSHRQHVSTNQEVIIT